MIERITNKKLAREGYFWARKFRTVESALTAMREYGIGECRVWANHRSKLPYWLLLKNNK